MTDRAALETVPAPDASPLERVEAEAVVGRLKQAVLLGRQRLEDERRAVPLEISDASEEGT